MKTEPAHFTFGYKATIQYYKMVLDIAADRGVEAMTAAKADLGATDLFFLLVFVLNRPDMNHPWLFDRCREVQRSPDGHLDLWAREHYKSTIITFGLNIFEIINDPEVTIGIFSHTKPVAKKFLAQIKSEMERNTELPRLWPEVFYNRPQSESPKWSEDTGIIVRRKGNPKESTIEAHGLVDGQPTGRHFDILHYDDVVTLESVSTPEQIIKVTDAWRMSDNLGSVGGRKRYAGTRYHLFDTYRVMMDDDVVIPRIYPATVDGREGGVPVLMPADVLAVKRKNQGPYIFGAQMLLNPTADTAMGFKKEWLRHGDTDYHAAMRSLWRFIIVDPSGGKSRKSAGNATTKQKNDYTSIFVIGHGEDEKYRVLDMVRDRLSLTQRADALFALHRLWKPSVVAYEEYGMQADIEHIQYVQKQELYEFTITPMGGAMSKEARILRLVAHFENGWKPGQDPDPRIILPTACHKIDYQGHNRDLVKDFVEQEYTAFPVLKHDDMLDCLARVIDLEEMGLIEKPRIVAAPVKDHSYNRGVKNLGKTGNNSWLTV
jgi:phage terminase large subunit-like protein